MTCRWVRAEWRDWWVGLGWTHLTQNFPDGSKQWGWYFRIGFGVGTLWLQDWKVKNGEVKLG